MLLVYWQRQEISTLASEFQDLQRAADRWRTGEARSSRDPMSMAAMTEAGEPTKEDGGQGGKDLRTKLLILFGLDHVLGMIHDFQDVLKKWILWCWPFWGSTLTLSPYFERPRKKRKK